VSIGGAKRDFWNSVGSAAWRTDARSIAAGRMAILLMDRHLGMIEKLKAEISNLKSQISNLKSQI
jgi:hypothetical protein